MEEFERIRQVRHRIGEVEEDLRSWRAWHCDRFRCKKYLCKQRDQKIYDLTMELGRLRTILNEYELSRLWRS
jgi:hypothetical protein